MSEAPLRFALLFAAQQPEVGNMPPSQFQIYPQSNLSGICPVRTVCTAGYPHPHSVDKFLVFKRLRGGHRAKVLLIKDLAAEYSQERGYGAFSGVFVQIVSHCGISLARRGACGGGFCRR